MRNPTNHDLHIMLTRIEERQTTVIKKLDDINKWQESHEKKDEERFSNLNKYAASIAIVSGSISACAVYVWNWLTGKS